MSLSKVIEIARGELGVTELPKGSNRVKYNTAYYGREVSGKDFPWCVTLQWWIFNEAGERMAFFGGGKTASCRTLLRWYQNMGQTVPVEQVQVGDIVILNFHGTKDTQHCGLAVDVGLKNGVYTVTTIEGNTSPGLEGSQDNGGCVALKERYIRQIIGVCRPQYKPDDPQPVDDVTGHWYTDDVRWCITQGLIKCYPDGSFQPDKPVTRAELATVLRRLILVEDEK